MSSSSLSRLSFCRNIASSRLFFFGVISLLLLTSPVPASADLRSTSQWTIFETTFTSASKHDNPYEDAQVTVDFKGPSGKSRAVQAFWDGGQSWKVRFSPDQIGRWTYQSHASPTNDSGLNNQTGEFECVPYKGANLLYKHGGIRVSANQRYLEQADGTPFFWVSDTAWNGPLKADANSWDTYLADRAAKQFSAVQFVMTQWIASPGNGDGRLAYQGHKDIAVDPVFFQWMDDRFKAVNEHGLVAAPVMIWTAPWSPYSKDFNPGNSLSDEQIIRLAKYMVARYEAYQVIWILAGDGDYRGSEADRWKHIGEAVFGDDHSRLASIHPGGHLWTDTDFGKELWFSFTGYQSGHGDGPDDLKWIWQGPPSQEWNTEPIHPIINLEPNYEGHISYSSHQRFDAHAVRRAAYWSLLVSPPAGVSYGAHGVWSWETRLAIPMNHLGSGTAHPWFEAINFPGSTDMKHLREMFSSLRWWTLRPDPNLVKEQPGDQDPAQFVAAARAEDKGWALLYFPVGQNVSLRLDELEQPNSIRWFNPRIGQWNKAAQLNADAMYINPPDANDWIAWIGHANK